MLNFNYTCDGENPNGTIFVILQQTCVETPYITPLNFSIKNSISGVEIWNGTLNNPGDWTSFPFGFHSEAEVTDLLGNSILKWEWDPFIHGDQIHKFFNAWSIRNRGAFGIAIGTHDGTSGEWVNPVMNGLLQGILIEASNNQFSELEKYYKDVPGAFPHMLLVTPDGGEKSFYELGKGHVNSLKIDHVKNYVGDSNLEIIEKRMKSTSIVDLFLKAGENKEIKWLHLDTEGVDAELILALDDPRITLPEVIIYESLNLSERVQSNMINWFSERDFNTLVCGWNTLAVRKAIL
jgi:hypothetical protein